MNVMIYDFETTGFPLYKEPSESDGQPHICEVAALLHDDETGKLIETFHAVVKPDGWIIPDEAAAIHGVTMERAMDEGKPENEVLAALLALHQRAEARVAHNESFDARIARIAIKRFGDGRATWQTLTQFEKDAIADDFKTRKSICTAKLATKPCGLPPTPAMLAKGMRFNKTPTMSEAYKHFTGRDLVGAHGALADTTACAEVYFAIQGVQ